MGSIEPFVKILSDLIGIIVSQVKKMLERPLEIFKEDDSLTKDFLSHKRGIEEILRKVWKRKYLILSIVMLYYGRSKIFSLLLRLLW